MLPNGNCTFSLLDITFFVFQIRYSEDLMNQFDEVISMNFGSPISDTKTNLQKFNEMAVSSLVFSTTQI